MDNAYSKLAALLSDGGALGVAPVRVSSDAETLLVAAPADAYQGGVPAEVSSASGLDRAVVKVSVNLLVWDAALFVRERIFLREEMPQGLHFMAFGPAGNKWPKAASPCEVADTQGFRLDGAAELWATADE